ncbi:hypothetical protein PsYK624_084750 [Phanerochaete sordida]|uniref:Uncharacterized protein n=1 Tax=Phanerochaete sordida TaxID=48140 RepID=A0A9P3LEA7_9APHY|nr:hypothetical protein PsYK624_084750 [Phanerochaete sordida]
MDTGSQRTLSLDGLRACIEIVSGQDQHDAAARAHAWGSILGIWNTGSTAALVEALLSPEVDAHVFIRDLLRRIYVRYLGKKTSILGTYECEAHTKKSAGGPAGGNAVRALVDTACLRDERNDQHQWSDMHQPPSIEEWTDPVPGYTPSDAALVHLHETIQEAAEAGQDLDFVVAKCLHEQPAGLLGCGRNAEARAYLFCRIASLYQGDALRLRPSPRAALLLEDVRMVVKELLMQMMPIVARFPGPSCQDTDGARAPSPLPFWLFLVHLTTSNALDLAGTLKTTVLPSALPAWRAFAPAPSADGTSEGTSDGAPRLSPLTPILWVLVGGTNRGTTDEIRVDDFAWLCAAPVSAVDDALRAHADALLAAEWRTTRAHVVRTLVGALTKTHTERWGAHTRAAARVLVDLYRCDLLTEDDARELGIVCLRLVALCDGAAAAFEEAVLAGADRALAAALFGAMLPWLSPFPTAAETPTLQALQATYAGAAYRSRAPAASLPPHLADRTILVLTALARWRTPLAQGAADAGAVALLAAVRAGRYPYAAHGPADDPHPPHVRALLRARAVEDAFRALSERMYLAAQAARVREGADGEGLAQAPPPRRMARPSWMATGG